MNESCKGNSSGGQAANGTQTSRKGIVLGMLVAGLVSVFADLPRAEAAAPEMLKVYRKFKSGSGADHLPTTNPNEASPTYVLEGAAWLYSRPYGSNGNTPAATNPVRRCFSSGVGRHYGNVAACLSGDTDEGTLGYALKSSRAGHTKLMQCKVASQTKHYFMSFDPNCEGQTVEGYFGYVLQSSIPSEASLSTGPDTQCMGRCGMGCNGWMPASLVGANIYTDQCLKHDQCVAQKGLLACMDGSFVAAAISYQVMTDILIVRAIGDALKSVFHW